MKTPMQELFYRVEQLRFAKNPIDELMMIRLEMLDKEKEVMCEFVFTARLDDYLTPDELFDKTFNTNDK